MRNITKKRKRTKKTVGTKWQICFELPLEMRERFKDECHAAGDTMSSTLRDFIKYYSEK